METEGELSCFASVLINPTLLAAANEMAAPLLFGLREAHAHVNPGGAIQRPHTRYSMFEAQSRLEPP